MTNLQVASVQAREPYESNLTSLSNGAMLATTPSFPPIAQPPVACGTPSLHLVTWSHGLGTKG